MRGAGRDWKSTSRGLAFGLGGWRLRALHLMAGGLPSDEQHLTAGGLPSDVDSSLHVTHARDDVSRNCWAFYLRARITRSDRLEREVMGLWRGRHRRHTRHVGACQDFQICQVVAHASPRRSRGARQLTGRTTDMARHTKIKLAALAASFVATLGIVAVGPATSADAGHAPAQHSLRGIEGCC